MLCGKCCWLCQRRLSLQCTARPAAASVKLEIQMYAQSPTQGQQGQTNRQMDIPVTSVPITRGRGICSGRSFISAMFTSANFLCCIKRILFLLCSSTFLSSIKKASEHLRKRQMRLEPTKSCDSTRESMDGGDATVSVCPSTVVFYSIPPSSSRTSRDRESFP